MMFGGIKFVVVDAQKQARTARDVPGEIGHRKCPPKESRKGTRKQWKRKYGTYRIMRYREPTDALRMGQTIIVTPRQYEALKK